MFHRCLSLFLVLSLLAMTGCGKAPEVDARDVFTEGEIQAGAALLPTHCNTCHGVDDKAADEMLAPPLWGVRAHYLAKYPDPEAFVSAMVEFMGEPTVAESSMSQAVLRYGLMEMISMEEAQLRAAAIAIYAGYVERPVWSRDYAKAHKDCYQK